MLGRVLGIVYRAIETHLVHRAVFFRSAVPTEGDEFRNLIFLSLMTNSSHGLCRLIPPTPYTPANSIPGNYNTIFSSPTNFRIDGGIVLGNLRRHSVTYRIGVGRRAGRKTFNLQTLPARNNGRPDSGLAKAAGFSPHCGVAVAAHQREKLERLCS